MSPSSLSEAASALAHGEADTTLKTTLKTLSCNAVYKHRKQQLAKLPVKFICQSGCWALCVSLKLWSRNENKPVKQKLRQPDCRSNEKVFGFRKTRVKNPALPLIYDACSITLWASISSFLNGSINNNCIGFQGTVSDIVFVRCSG